MSAAFHITSFEAIGWAFRLDGIEVKATPSVDASEDGLSAIRQHRETIRAVLLLRGGHTVGDIVHDAAVAADRDDGDLQPALDGTAQQLGFTDFASAQHHMRVAEACEQSQAA